MSKEIGSEFWNAGPRRRDSVYLLSGRTALEYIIRDILKIHTVSSVLLPSYCCHTMIEPFCRHGISIRFYDVFFDGSEGITAEIPTIQEDEIFYYLTYFGFGKINGIPIERIRNESEVIIEDCTHSWLTGKQLECSDYSYTSYRKWTGFSGIANASKSSGCFAEIPCERNEVYCEMRRRAYAMKQDYIENGTGEKQAFLSLFGEAEELLEENYVGYLPEDQAVVELLNFDMNRTRDTRRRNATVLLNGLKRIPEISVLCSEMSDSDSPLFVPILVPYDRTGLRKYLIEKSIYCPIHWPLSSYHEGISERAKMIYEQELSLLCDQRYDEDDMHRIIDSIQAYYMR